MPMDELEPTVAVVAIDLQVATTGLPSAVPMAGVVETAARVLDAFRGKGLPVVLVRADLNHPPVGRTAYDRPRPAVPEAALELVPEIGRGPDDVVITRSGWSAFAGSGLDEVLRARGVTQLVLLGLATNFGVESTARAAYDLGYHVLVVEDAVNSPMADGHRLSLTQLLPALGLVVSADEVVAALG